MDFKITRQQALAAGAVVSIGAITVGAIAARRLLGEGSDDRMTETFSETYDVSELAVVTDVGSISVLGADRETVELEIEQRGTEHELDRTTLAVDEHDDTLDVTIDYDQTVTEWLGVTADSRPATELVCTVPHDFEHAVLETVNGHIDASELESALDAETTNGGITLDDVSTIDSLSSTNGEIEADAEALANDATIETTNGDIAVSVAELEGDATVESTNGAIDYAVGESTDATVTVTTSNGDISLTTERANPLVRTDDELEATVGDGTNRLQFETTNGDVTITE